MKETMTDFDKEIFSKAMAVRVKISIAHKRDCELKGKKCVCLNLSEEEVMALLQGLNILYEWGKQ